MTGAELSVTVTVCVAVAVFPFASVTVHVTVVFPDGNVVGALFVTVATEQLSAVTGVPNATPVAEQPEFDDTVTFAGAVMLGKTLSITVTIEVQVEATLRLSVKVYVMVLVPFWKSNPEIFPVPVEIEAFGFVIDQVNVGQLPMD